MIINFKQTMDKVRNQTLTTLLDVCSIAFLILFPHLAPLPFYLYAVICLVVIWFLLRKKGMSFRDLGLSKSRFTVKTILAGIISGLIWVVFMQFIYIPVIKSLFIVTDYTEYNFIQGSLSKLIMTISAAWLIGGFYEEIVFRGYIQSLFEKWISKNSRIPWSIIITSLLFGIYHWQQDIFGIIAAMLGGLYWGFLYRKYNNNLWIVILSHALFDTITLLLIYTGVFGNLN